jgi:hypothetical protein
LLRASEELAETEAASPSAVREILDDVVTPRIEELRREIKRFPSIEAAIAFSTTLAVSLTTVVATDSVGPAQAAALAAAPVGLAVSARRRRAASAAPRRAIDIQLVRWPLDP